MSGEISAIEQSTRLGNISTAGGANKTITTTAAVEMNMIASQIFIFFPLKVLLVLMGSNQTFSMFE
jgi:hypothetical protein